MTHRNRRDIAPAPAADGPAVRELIGPASSVLHNHSLHEVTLAPGQATAEHFHREAEEILYVLRGQGQFQSSGLALPGQAGDAIPSEFPIGAGDVVPVPAGRKHSILNVGKQNLVFLCASSPACRGEDTVLEQK